MPFVRVSRDKRGYEHFFLVQPVAGARDRSHQQVLYWFRTPPNVRVGREPFDEAVRRALEAQNPGIVFDWELLRHTPVPAPLPEYWRERRRAERAARRLSRGEEDGPALESGARADQPAVEHAASEPTDAALGGQVRPSPSAAKPGRHRRRRRGGRHLEERQEGVAGAPAQAETTSQPSTVLEAAASNPTVVDTEKPAQGDYDES